MFLVVDMVLCRFDPYTHEWEGGRERERERWNLISNQTNQLKRQPNIKKIKNMIEEKAASNMINDIK